MMMSEKKDKDFIKLQNKWYKKLEKQGFNDLEWTNPETGKGQNSPWLKKPVYNLLSTYNKNVQNHYRSCENFLTNGTFPSKKHQYVFKLYSEGFSYRQMIPKIYNHFKTGKRSFSVFWIHTRIHECLALMRQFNLSDDEGVRYSEDDLEYEDRLIAEIDAKMHTDSSPCKICASEVCEDEWHETCNSKKDAK